MTLVLIRWKERQAIRVGAYWNVNSAGVFRKRYSRDKKEVSPLPSVGVSPILGLTELITTMKAVRSSPAGDSPMTSSDASVSDSKGTNNSETDKKNVADGGVTESKNERHRRMEEEADYEVAKD